MQQQVAFQPCIILNQCPINGFVSAQCPYCILPLSLQRNICSKWNLWMNNLELVLHKMLYECVSLLHVRYKQLNTDPVNYCTMTWNNAIVCWQKLYSPISQNFCFGSCRNFHFFLVLWWKWLILFWQIWCNIFSNIMHSFVLCVWYTAPMSSRRPVSLANLLGCSSFQVQISIKSSQTCQRGTRNSSS